MSKYKTFSREEKEAELSRLKAVYEDYQRQKLSLNMARGKPSSEQMDMTESFLKMAHKEETLYTKDGVDCRNYGGLTGITEMREIFASMLEVDVEDVLAMNNSSLELMFLTVSYAMTHKRPGASKPWAKEDKIKFLCPVPGYDRHFNLSAHFGFELIQVEMTKDGPNMDQVEALCKNDHQIKGIWCVPKYSNPDGYVYSTDVCKRLASMEAASDFTIMWDNTYCVHHLYDEVERQLVLPNLLELAKNAGHENRVVMFGSTSKMTFAGSGVGAVCMSKEMREWFLGNYQYQNIGPDKIVQLDTVRLIQAAGGIKELMKKHAASLRPKFEIVLKTLEEQLGVLDLAKWHSPLGGYFISVFLLPHHAKKVVAMCKEAGVVLTQAGATYPNKEDKEDSNIRIAPSFPPLEELKKAIEIFCVCVKISALEEILAV